MQSRSWVKWTTAWVLWLDIAVGVGAGTAGAVTTSASQPIGGTGVSKPAASSAFREIKWDDLVPKDWDPLKQFKGINFSLMNDSDPRANEMLKRMRETWDNAPTNNDLDGASVRIPGYLVPLEDTKSGLNSCWCRTSAPASTPHRRRPTRSST